MATTDRTTPYVSIVIPVYNEEGILREAISDLRAQLAPFGWSYEILICENGSSDQTVALGQHLAGEMAEVRVLSVGAPNYGLAMRQGILEATGEFVICDEIDLCDTDFYRRAMDLLEHDDADLVVGSKAMKGAYDQRPMVRRLATRVINGMLRVALDFRGTDTHGLKAFRRARILPIVHQCVIDKDLFASELVIRAGREGRHVVEIPVQVAEKRRPAINLVRRVPHVLRGLAHLTYAIRVQNGRRE
ncbi:glycosyltransferase family 2 protein [Haliangium sp.]|uniref:glycosyltransferase family 2 protein n=1 Tax=Haliangium sp. TaxID=2663208 RepID=UPI003D0D2933